MQGCDAQLVVWLVGSQVVITVMQLKSNFLIAAKRRGEFPIPVSRAARVESSIDEEQGCIFLSFS